MIEIIFCYIQEFFRIYVLNRWINIFFGNNYKNKYVHLFFLILCCIIKGTFRIIVESSKLNLITTFFFLLIIVGINYLGTIGKKLLVVLSVVSFAMLCENIVCIIFNKYFVTVNNDFAGGIISIFLLLALEILLQKCLYSGKSVSIFTFNYIFMLMIPLCSIVITDIIIDGYCKEKYIQLVGISMLMFINIFSIYLYDEITKKYEERWKNDILERQISMYRNQFKIIKEAQEKLKSFRHDLKHHYIMMYEYAKNGESQKLSDYFYRSIEYIEVEREYVKSGNEDVDYILNYMLDRANKIGVNVEVRVKVQEEKIMPSFDLNILLANLLENAIEALEQASEKRLSLYINMNKGILYISIYNTYNIIQIKHGKLMSMKRNGENRGIGIDSIKKIVDKYNGKMNIKYDEQVFKVDIILFLLV